MKCHYCRNFPPDRGANCAYRFACGDEPGADSVMDGCPTACWADEPTDGEMLDFLGMEWTTGRSTRVAYNPNFENPWIVYGRNEWDNGKTLRETISKVMKAMKEMEGK